jgi:2,5-dihydroxypyridine 5,6-dioxygenase
MSYGRLASSPALATELMGLFRHQLSLCNLRPGELCAVITDTAYNPVTAAACMGAALEMGAEVAQTVVPWGMSPWGSDVSSRALSGAIAHADLIMSLTTHRLHYRAEIRAALDRGARAVITMEPVHVLSRLRGDEGVMRRSKAGAALLGPAREIRVKTAAGTDLVMDKSGRPALANYGYADAPGHMDFWAAGMIQTAQREGTLEGTLVLDSGDVIFHLGRHVEHPVRIAFERGRIASIEGGTDALMLRKHFESYDEPKSWLAGHTSIGTDPRALWVAQAIRFPETGAGGADSESYLGNVQIQVGSNDDVLFQGTNDAKAHVGMCMLNASVWLDGAQILAEGRFVPESMR